jgi:membrane protease YdiL (CAAX protease family)
MNLAEDNSLDPEKQDTTASPSDDNSEKVQTSVFVFEPADFSNIPPPIRPIPFWQRPDIPEDLRITWSWVHFLCFIGFSVMSLIIVQTALMIHYSPHQELSPKELQDYLLGLPQFVVGTTVALFAIVFLFLYVTLAVLPGRPFWSNLGWKKWRPSRWPLGLRILFFFVLGAILSLFVSLVGSQVQVPDNLPINELMKSRLGFFLMMGMAVAIAPLVEETLFRGYLYPLLVRLISTASQHFGAESAKATKAAVSISILITGVLFGLLHGAQLSWTWGIVSLLIFVGIIFTYVRARSGTVFASFLMHFGYNLLIAVISLFETHGFKNLPPR